MSSEYNKKRALTIVFSEGKQGPGKPGGVYQEPRIRENEIGDGQDEENHQEAGKEEENPPGKKKGEKQRETLALSFLQKMYFFLFYLLRRPLDTGVYREGRRVEDQCVLQLWKQRARAGRLS